MIKNIATMAIVVRDTDKAAQWYTEKLGLQIKDRQEHWVTVAPKGARGVQLHLCQTKPAEKGNTGIMFLADDLKKTYKDLSGRGVKFTVKPVDKGWGMHSMFKDPDGNEFWLMEA